MNIVIVGRPNVGKSSLFNRLLGKKRALVLDTPGVTRDRIVEPAIWWVGAREYHLNLIDTGGLGEGRFKEEIADQVNTALQEAALVLFVMDVRTGITHADEAVFNELRRSGLKDNVPVIGVINKVDHESFEEEMHEFYRFGLETLMPVSAEHNIGIDDLKDIIIEMTKGEPLEKQGDEDSDFDQDDEVETNVENNLDSDSDDNEDSEIDEEKIPLVELKEVEDEYVPRMPSIAIVGQPNVGKSTLLNVICGSKRSIVSPIAGTTVDAVDTTINWFGKDYLLIDTAGIRRKNKTEQGIEVLSVVQTKKALERADLALLLIDAEKGVYDQDEKIAGMIEEMGCAVILVLNKWDTQVDNDEFSQKAAEEMLRKQIRFLGYAPLVFTTAKDGIGLERLHRMIDYVIEQRRVKLNTRELTEFAKVESEIHNPHNAKFYLTHQTGRHPPTFISHVNDPKRVDFSLSRHLVKALRARWGFLGSPIRFHFVKAKNTGEGRKK